MSDATKSHTEDEDIKRRVLENLNTLDRSGKLEVLGFSEELSSRSRPPESQRDTRRALLKYAGTITREDLDIISEVIEEECERVDKEDW